MDFEQFATAHDVGHDSGKPISQPFFTLTVPYDQDETDGVTGGYSLIVTTSKELYLTIGSMSPSDQIALVNGFQTELEDHDSSQSGVLTLTSKDKKMVVTLIPNETRRYMYHVS